MSQLRSLGGRAHDKDWEVQAHGREPEGQGVRSNAVSPFRRPLSMSHHRRDFSGRAARGAIGPNVLWVGTEGTLGHGKSFVHRE